MRQIPLILLVALAGIALSLLMTAAWTLQRRTGNTGWVDVVWSFGVGGVGFVGSLLPLDNEWPQWRQFLVAGLAAAWCLRLGLHIASRTRATGDDPRYRALIEQWGAEASRRMFVFLQAQAAVGSILELSIILAAHNPDSNLRLQDLFGLAMFAVAISGEAIADRQLRAFRANPGQRSQVCDVGLWRWSRHPNYFFEWVSWLAYPIIAIDFSGRNPLGWLAIAAPVFMYWTLVYVSGIPPLEEHMLRSRGEQFRAYQKRTSAFFPWPPY